MCERLLGLAQTSLNIEAAIFRPSTITGTSNIKDFSNLFMRGVVLLGAYPIHYGTSNYVPVEFCALAISAMSLDAKTYSTGLFHVTNPNGNIDYDTLFKCVEGYGYPLDGVPLEDFHSRLLQSSNNPLFPLINRFNSPTQTDEPLMSATLAWMASHEVQCPPMDRALIRQYLKTFVRKGLLPKPKKASVKK